MLYDKDFLLKLDKNRNKTIYARITALTFSELPTETIEGRVTQGSINIDGTSAVRRSCSLTIVAQDFNYSDYYWGLNTKFKLEIGVENTIDFHYPDIIWFKQGIFLITTFNTSRTTNNFTINLQGKDKMSLLNGEIGGNLESSVDFGTIEEENQDGIWTIRKVPIQEIIKNAVHHYAGEPYYNIIINDLDTYGLELLEYRYDTDMYLYRKPDTWIYTNVMIANDQKQLHYKKDLSDDPKSVKELKNEYLDLLTDTFTGVIDPKPVYDNEGNEWIFTKIEYGQTAGYRMTDLVYPGDLIGNIGESITSILDKIKAMLVEFEYFYNLEGQFVFQKKQSFVSTMWTPSKKDNDGNEYIEEGLALASAHSYMFSGNELISAFNNNPNLLNMRNDYSIWGNREAVSGAKIPVHMRYAIDVKPTAYRRISVSNDDEQLIEYNEKYGTTLKGTDGLSEKEMYFSNKDYDWREIIYQMALDYFRFNHLDNFELKVRQANPDLYPTGRTGYEQYYTDMQGFWRQLYYPELKEKVQNKANEVKQQENIISELEIYIYGEGKLEDSIVDLNNKISDNDSVTQTTADNLRNRYKLNYEDYSPTGILSMLQKHYQDKRNELDKEKTKLETLNAENEKLSNLKNDYYLDATDDKKYWNTAVFEAPYLLNFWFDFLDTQGELNQFSVKAVGSRTKSINDTAVKSIYFRETPDVIFQQAGKQFGTLTGFRYIQVPDIESMFSISAQGKSAKDRLDELIYQHGYCIEGATITSIPIYYLQPNTRVYVHDEDTGVDGDYIVSKLTIPLTYNGTMSITATKAAENII